MCGFKQFSFIYGITVPCSVLRRTRFFLCNGFIEIRRTTRLAKGTCLIRLVQDSRLELPHLLLQIKHWFVAVVFFWPLKKNLKQASVRLNPSKHCFSRPPVAVVLFDPVIGLLSHKFLLTAKFLNVC